MILCIDINSIAPKGEVQRDVDLADLIDNHTRYFENDKEALANKYVPLGFSMSLRTMYTNKVLKIPNLKTGRSRYYENRVVTDKFIHKGEDLIMYITSLCLMQCVNYKKGFDELMLRHSQIQFIGLVNPDPLIIDPIIYSHVILSDEGGKELTTYLKEGFSLVDISDMKNNYAGNIPMMLDTLIEVKNKEVKWHEIDWCW